MAKIIEIIVVILTLWYTGIYLREMMKGRVKPVLATWLLFVLGTSLSIVTNFKETGVQGFGANIFNLTDALGVTIIFLFALFRPNTNRRFDTFEKSCLSAVGIVFIFWLLSGQSVVSHLLVQCVFVVAYLPTLRKLWSAEANTESIVTWSLNTMAAGLGIIPPLINHDLLPLVYCIRGTVSAFLVVVFSLRAKNKHSKRI